MIIIPGQADNNIKQMGANEHESITPEGGELFDRVVSILEQAQANVGGGGMKMNPVINGENFIRYRLFSFFLSM